MISVIVCSKGSPDSFFTQNIHETIGCEHELVVIDNSGNKYGICEAYNIGASKSRFNTLVFIHEDILFRTQNWGSVILELVRDEKIGIIGCAGSIVKSQYPTAWTDVPEKYYRINMIDGWSEEKKRHKTVSPGTQFSEVVVLDGMFLCMRKKLWDQFKFDENEIKGFHLYDLDISLRIGAHYLNIVSHNILVEHLSPGNFSKGWFLESIHFHNRWKKHLPKSTNSFSKREKRQIQYYALVKCIKYYIAFYSDEKHILNYLALLFFYRPLSRYNLVLLKEYMKQRILK